MITDFFFGMLRDFLQAILDLLPDSVGVPDAVLNTVNGMIAVLDAAASLGVWLPMDLAVLCFIALVNVYLGGMGVKFMRILISHFTGGGGAA